MDHRSLLMHQVMLGDRVRLDAYDAALARTVRPGDVVVDVGAGSLVLSLLALRHGAGHVYAIEGDPSVAMLAAAVAEQNALQGRVTVVQGDARTVELPNDVDVIVTEMMGNLGPEEQMAEVVAAVADRHLAPGGRIVPERVVTRFQAVEMGREGWGVWSDDLFGFSMAAGQDFAPPAAQLHFFRDPPVALSEPVVVADERLGRTPDPFTDRTSLEIVESGTLQAVIGSFEATLAGDITLSNHPAYPGCNWAVWVWPLRHTRVEAGVTLDIQVERPADERVAADWRLSCGLAHPARATAP